MRKQLSESDLKVKYIPPENISQEISLAVMLVKLINT